MKQIAGATLMITAIIGISSCNYGNSLNLDSGTDSSALISSISNTEDTGKKVKAPKLRQWKIKKAIEYDMALTGTNNISTTIDLGYFPVDNDEQMQKYASLAANGLVNVASSSILNRNLQPEKWISVSLTKEGEKYLVGSDFTNHSVTFDPQEYHDFLHPSEGVYDEYGCLIEDPEVNANVKKLFADFYSRCATNEKDAIRAFGEKEFVEAYERLEGIDTYNKMTGAAPQIPFRAFSAGSNLTEETIKAVKCYYLPKYENCYKIYFYGGDSVLLIVSNDEKSIFDLVLDEDSNRTIRTVNKSWSEARLKNLIELVNKKNTMATAAEIAKPSERQWYAPGLVLADRIEPYAIDIAEENSYRYSVNVKLYGIEVERVYKVVTGGQISTDPTRECDFTATARVVYKITDVTPFQFVLENTGSVIPLNKELFFVNNVNFKYYEDCGWCIE